MSDLPDPMTPPDCDLRGYDFMPLFGNKLFGSKLYSMGLRNPRAGLAAIKLWWAAWQQCPAGSLPNDDDDLCVLADFGSDVDGWQKARDIALRGFVLCSDGRLYHPILCEEATFAFARRRFERERKAEQRARKRGPKPAENSELPQPVERDVPSPSQACPTGQPADVLCNRTEQDRTGQEEERKEEPPTPKAKGGKGKAPATPMPDIPDWMPQPAWDEFVESRRQMRKPMTAIAMRQQIRNLDRWRLRGLDIASAIEASTANGYQGVFEPKTSQLRLVHSQPAGGGVSRGQAARDYWESQGIDPAFIAGIAGGAA